MASIISCSSQSGLWGSNEPSPVVLNGGGNGCETTTTISGRGGKAASRKHPPVEEVVKPVKRSRSGSKNMSRELAAKVKEEVSSMIKGSLHPNHNLAISSSLLPYSSLSPLCFVEQYVTGMQKQQQKQQRQQQQQQQQHQQQQAAIVIPQYQSQPPPITPSNSSMSLSPAPSLSSFNCSLNGSMSTYPNQESLYYQTQFNGADSPFVNQQQPQWVS